MRVGFTLLVVNAAWLATRADASAFHFANVGLHVVLGVAVCVEALVWWRGRSPLGGALALAVPGLVACAATGAVLAVVGATRPHYGWLVAHGVAALAGGVPAVVALWPGRAAAEPAGRLRAGLAGVAGFAIVVGLAAIAAGARNAPEVRIVNPALPPSSMDGEGGGPDGPFFPSSAETDVGGIIPAGFFLTSQECGRCHPDIYEQWRSSAHHFSSFNNQWYRASVEYMQDVVGTRPSRWCAGCHDHAMFFNGRFDRPAREQIDTPEAQAGLGCTSCHAVVHVKSTMGQADFVVEYPPLHDLAVSDQPALRLVHDYLLRLDPEPHRRTFLKSFHTEQTPEFCSTCHKVHLDVPVNDYRWFRGFDEYDNWQSSGVSGHGARSFYYPPEPRHCGDCHMPLVASDDPAARDGKVHSHRFPGANTAIPFVNGDTEQLRVTQEFLRAGQVTLDVFALVHDGSPATGASAPAPAGPQLASTFAQGEEAGSFGTAPAVVRPPAPLSAPLGAVRGAVRRGESVRVDVVLRTRGVGHFFPGGTVDGFDVWVELEAVDETGRVVFHSGGVDDGGSGPVEPGAHFYRSLMLDGHGNPVNRRNAWMARSVAYVRLVPPGAADTIRFRLDVPGDCGDRLTLRARLNYRKFAWWLTQWAFAGVRDPAQDEFALAAGWDDGRWLFTGDTSNVSGDIKAIPDIPITVMARAETSLDVLPRGAPEPEPELATGPDLRERWNDYGIGLLLQGDVKAAEAAFVEVTRMEPGYADGWVNVARARLREGNVEGAEAMLRRALEVDPDLAKTQFFLGLALKAQGRYGEALGHLEAAAAAYPRDRVVSDEIGRVLFLDRRFAEAVEAYRRTLSVDPEDLAAHYGLMLAYRGLGDSKRSLEHETLYRRFKADESSQTITGDYRLAHPADNNERQPIHEHRSTATARYGAGGAAP